MENVRVSRSESIQERVEGIFVGGCALSVVVKLDCDWKHPLWWAIYIYIYTSAVVVASVS